MLTGFRQRREQVSCFDWHGYTNCKWRLGAAALGRLQSHCALASYAQSLRQRGHCQRLQRQRVRLKGKNWCRVTQDGARICPKAGTGEKTKTRRTG